MVVFIVHVFYNSHRQIGIDNKQAVTCKGHEVKTGEKDVGLDFEHNAISMATPPLAHLVCTLFDISSSRTFVFLLPDSISSVRLK